MNVALNKGGRIDVADVLRGFAVMGIILLHSIEHFNFGLYPNTETQGGLLNFLDSAIWDGMFFTFGGKAYAIFALLFGFSFFIMDNNQQLRGSDFRLRFCWRLVLLFIIGNFNAAFFTGEILVLYSLVGFVLPLTCRLSDRNLLLLASFLMLQPLHMIYTFISVCDPAFVTPVIPTREFWAATRAMQSSGTFFEMVATNLKEGQLAGLSWYWDHGRMFQTASLFMFGLLIGRKRLFLESNLSVWYRVVAISLMLFFPLYGLKNMLPDFISNASTLKPLSLIITSWSNVAFMLLLVSGVIIAFYKVRSAESMLRCLIPYGKMSLTNYIMQSIVGSMLFYHWGLFLAKSVGITGSYGIGILLFVAQLSFCHWWLKSHKYGPLEYLWRRATWLK
ncbi:MAG: DUF418 domain-containing protein [Rikenellaceae bacterium]